MKDYYLFLDIGYEVYVSETPPTVDDPEFITTIRLHKDSVPTALAILQLLVAAVLERTVIQTPDRTLN